MALCNVVGDLGYLGFAFASYGFVSIPKLIGAGFTMAAHTILLAYGDDQARKVAAEEGRVSRLVLRLRSYAKRMTSGLPEFVLGWLRAKPVGVTFSMLALNGVGLVADACLATDKGLNVAAIQAGLGLLIVAGTLAFAAADFVRGQKTANALTKLAPSILVGASVANACLAVATCNPFLIIAVAAFAVSNLAGFFTKIDKNEPISAGI
ncbi:MAG: hypothetical protein M3N08_01025 [Pseudomonadota bacterium]|nr:hypothetical protein [Pseudomonadota bacterium]